MADARRILLIYTGGTIGMKENPATGALAPFNFDEIEREVPELGRFGHRIDVETLLPLVDSSDVEPSFWMRLGGVIASAYNQYDGFVVLHGTDTMAYTASALSFLLCGLDKPVILTGSQLPIGALRTDGKENLVGAVEVASAHVKGLPIVPEVCVFFNHALMRGNRCTKFGAERFDAFRSFNYPLLAEAGISIRYNLGCILAASDEAFAFRGVFDTRVATVRLYPGIRESFLRAVLGLPGLRGVILETYGAGNAPGAAWVESSLTDFVQGGGIAINITQCPADSVAMTTYDAGLGLARAGVVSGGDMTYEAAVVKLMLALGLHDREAALRYFEHVHAGEKSV